MRKKRVDLPQNVTNTKKLDQYFAVFTSSWNKLDEETKELLAAGLYLLNQESTDIPISHYLSRHSLTEERKEYLTRLVDFTANA